MQFIERLKNVTKTEVQQISVSTNGKKRRAEFQYSCFKGLTTPWWPAQVMGRQGKQEEGEENEDEEESENDEGLAAAIKWQAVNME